MSFVSQRRRGLKWTVQNWWGELRQSGWRQATYTSDTDCVIIGGCGRSGTTLLRVMLDTHSRICCGPESALFRPDPPRIARLAPRFGMDPMRLKKLKQRARSQAEFVDLFFTEYCQIRGKARWAEKTPRNILYLDYIFAHFPRARVIHVIRDGRDVVCSLRTHPRDKLVNEESVSLNTWNPVERCVDRWVNDVQAGLRFRGDTRYMEIYYEELVARPEDTIREVMEFINEPFEESVLEFYKVEGLSRDGKYFLPSTGATRPLYRQSIGRWKAELSKEELELFMERASGLMKEVGYM